MKRIRLSVGENPGHRGRGELLILEGCDVSSDSGPTLVCLLCSVSPRSVVTVPSWVRHALGGTDEAMMSTNNVCDVTHLPENCRVEIRYQYHLNYRHWDERCTGPFSAADAGTGWSSDWPDVALAPFERLCPTLLTGTVLMHGALIALPVLDTLLVFKVALPEELPSQRGAYLVTSPSSLQALVITTSRLETLENDNNSTGNRQLEPTPSARALLSRITPLCLDALRHTTPSPLSFRTLLLSGPKGAGKTFVLGCLLQAVTVRNAHGSGINEEGGAVVIVRLDELRPGAAASDQSVFDGARVLAGGDVHADGMQEMTRILLALLQYCGDPREAAAVKLALSGGQRGVRVIVVADDLDEVLSVSGGMGAEKVAGEDDGNGEAAASTSPTGRLAWMLRRLSSLVVENCSRAGHLKVLLLGATSLPPQSIPRSSAGAPQFEKVVRLCAPTLQDRRVLLLERLQRIGFALGPGPVSSANARVSSESTSTSEEGGSPEGCEEEWASALAHLTAGYLPGDLAALATRMHCIHVGAMTLDSPKFKGEEHGRTIAWTTALQALTLAVPVHMQELGSYVSSLGGSIGNGTGREVGPSWIDFVGDESLVRGLQRILRQGGAASAGVAEGSSSKSGRANTCTSAYLASRTPRGIVLHGPPACGKTFLARILARESGRHFLSIRSPDLLSQYFGQTEANVRGIFARARAAGGCVLLFDEFEVLACRRGQGDDDTGLQGRVLSTFLNELDGVSGGGVGKRSDDYGDDTDEGDGGGDLLVIVACSDIELLDEALLRPGRLQHHVFLGPPSQVEVATMLAWRLEALKTKGTLCEVDESLVMSHLWPSQPRGADIDALVRNAVLGALRGLISSGESVVPQALLLKTDHFLDALPPLPTPFVLSVPEGAAVFAAGTHNTSY